MGKIITIVLLYTLSSSASLLDFITIDDAEQAYSEGNYSKSSKLFLDLAKNSSEARFNYATSLYKEHKYSRSIDEYMKIPSDSNLRDDALYNIGNAQVQTKEFDDAKKSYEEALKITTDDELKEKIEYNLKKLEELKKRQDEEKKESDDKDDKSDKDNKSDKESDGKDGEPNKDNNSDESGQNSSDSKNDNKDNQDKGGEPQEDDKSDQDGSDSSKKDGSDQESDAQNQDGATEQKREPISDMEERKYSKMLDSRGIQTMMIPLEPQTKGGADEESPW